MPLTPGTKLGLYEIVAPLGAGGMGEVYRARDAKLGRDVAIKVLPQELASNTDRLARFEREARVLAALNHSNVAAIYGFDSADGRPFLVMELVPGQTLADRIAEGALPLDETIPIFLQIAEGLSAAHDKGIVHRDLKPANVKLTPDGHAKVLDFGLAKALDGGEGSDGQLSHSPTLTMAATRRGEIMGTAAYMSPEQARGKAVDKRTDIWAFGCVLFEALTGVPPFIGETVTDTLAAIVKSDPEWDRLPAEIPQEVRRLLSRCLEKDARRRLHDVADARIELEVALGAAGELEPRAPRAASPFNRGAASGGTTAMAHGAQPRSRMNIVPLAAASLLSALVAGLAVWALVRPKPPSREPVRLFEIPTPNLVAGSTIAISPDGSTVAFVNFHKGDFQLSFRMLDDLEPRAIEGTDGAQNPFFSPDGQWIGFFTEQSLQKVSISGGAPVVLCNHLGFSGGAWGADDMIIFTAPTNGQSTAPGLAKISAAGGSLSSLTTPDVAKGELFHYWPAILPDGEHVLFTVSIEGRSVIEVVSMASGERRVLVENGSNPRYAHSGHLLYFDTNDALMAVRFDAKSLQVTGEPFRVVEKIHWVGAGSGAYDISDDGTLVYAPPFRTVEATVVWVDRSGRIESLIDAPASWAQPRISPDGRQMVVRKTASPNCDLWLFDFDRDALTRFTHAGDNHDPVWSADGSRITFGCELPGMARALYWLKVDGSAEPESLSRAGHPRVPESWSSDGRYLALTEERMASVSDIAVLDTRDGEVRPFVATEFQENYPRFSPDGRWLAYTSNESGKDEVYVRAFPGPGAKYQVSTAGGTGPLWSRDGRELFYASDDSLRVVDVTTTPAFRASAPRALFGGDFVFERVGNYDVAPDGKRFVIVQRVANPDIDKALRVVLNWDQSLERASLTGER